MSAETQAERTRAVTGQTLAAHRWQIGPGGASCSCGRLYGWISQAGVEQHRAHQADEAARALADAGLLATEHAQTADTLTDDEQSLRCGWSTVEGEPLYRQSVVERILAARQAGDRDAHQALIQRLRALTTLPPPPLPGGTGDQYDATWALGWDAFRRRLTVVLDRSLGDADDQHDGSGT